MKGEIMSRQKLNRFTARTLLILILALTACGGGKSNSQGSGGNNGNGGSQQSQPKITLHFSDQELREMGTEVIPQNNCGGSEAVSNQIQRTRSIQHTMEVGGGFQMSAGGQVGIAGTGVELGTTVASNLGFGYGVSESLSKSITVGAAAGKNMEHTVNLEEIWQKGNALVTIAGKQYTVPFSFRKDFQLTLENSKIVKDCSTANLSPLEKMAGDYTLASWSKVIRPIELDGKVIDGSLTINNVGLADWKVLLEQTFASNPGRVEMTARGQIDINAMLMQGKQGGEYNNTHYLDSKWGQVSGEMNLAVRGWNFGDPNDPFHLNLDEQSNGRFILQMQNSYGTFYWEKKASGS